MCIDMDGSQKDLPLRSNFVSDNKISRVYLYDDWIYKRSIPYLIENEYSYLYQLWPSGYVPKAYRYDKFTLQIQYLGKSEPVTDPELFMKHINKFLTLLKFHGFRHGDLTTPHVIVKANRPYIIDWAESRIWGDNAPDKRPEGDEYWLLETARKLMS